MTTNHQELLERAVAAHEALARAKDERAKAFYAAISGTVTAREIARATGLSPSTVASIKQRHAANLPKTEQ